MSGRDIHDAFFKRVFGRPDMAADLWQRLLPAELMAVLDVERAERVETERIDDDLRSSRADLIFRIPLRGRAGRCAFVFLLMEHQSSPDPLMPFRVLAYGVAASSDFIADHKAEHGRPPRRLPAFIPIVVHQGPGRWRAPRRLSEVFDLPLEVTATLGPHLPEMELVIDDLAAADDEALMGTAPLTAAALMVMRYVRDERDTRSFLERWIRRLDAAMDDGDARSMIEVLARYLYDASDRLQLDEIVDAARGAATRHSEALMSLADRIEEQGRLKGIEQGIEQGQARGARNILVKLLQLRFGDVPDRVMTRLEAADAQTLERWAGRVLSANTVDDVLMG